MRKRTISLNGVLVVAAACGAGTQCLHRALGDEPAEAPHVTQLQPSGAQGGISPNPRPVVVKQPDGTVLKLWFQGSPFYNWYEDEQGYTVVHDKNGNGYVYARSSPTGDLVPDRSLVVGKVNPAKAGLPAAARPTREAIERARLRTGRMPAEGDMKKTTRSGAYTKVTSEVISSFHGGDDIKKGVTDSAVTNENASASRSKVAEGRQSNGLTIQLLNHGDWLSDAKGFAVVWTGKDYVYAVRDSQGALVPIEQLLVGQVDPAKSGLRPHPLASKPDANPR